MDEKLWSQITPETCFKYHPQMRAMGIIDRVCVCKEEPCYIESSSIPQKRNEDKELVSITKDVIPMKEG